MNKVLVNDIENLGFKFVSFEKNEYIFNHVKSDVDFIVEDRGISKRYGELDGVNKYTCRIPDKNNSYNHIAWFEPYNILIEKIKTQIRFIDNSENGLIRPCDFFEYTSLRSTTTGSSGHLKKYWHYPCIAGYVKFKTQGIIILKLKKAYAAYLYRVNDVLPYDNVFTYIRNLSDGMKLYNQLQNDKQEVKEIDDKYMTDIIAKMV